MSSFSSVPPFFGITSGWFLLVLVLWFKVFIFDELHPFGFRRWWNNFWTFVLLLGSFFLPKTYYKKNNQKVLNMKIQNRYHHLFDQSTWNIACFFRDGCCGSARHSLIRSIRFRCGGCCAWWCWWCRWCWWCWCYGCWWWCWVVVPLHVKTLRLLILNLPFLEDPQCHPPVLGL